MQHNMPPSTPVKGTKYQKLNNNHRSQSAQGSKSHNNTGYSMGHMPSDNGLITPQTVSRFKNTQSTKKKVSSQHTPKPKNSGNSFLNTAAKRMLQTPQNNDEDIREKLLTDMFMTPNIFNPSTPMVKLKFDSDSDNDMPHTPTNKIMTFEDAENLHNNSSKKNVTYKNKKLIKDDEDDEEIYIKSAVLKNPFLSDDSSSEENKVKKKLSFK